MSSVRTFATIAATTKEELDRFAEERGLEPSLVVEQALLYFMATRRELPDEAFIPTRIVLENEAFDDLMGRLERPAVPTEALRELMGRRK